MQVKYIGRHRNGVEVAGSFVEYGGTVEVDDEAAESLLSQNNQWEAVKAAPSKKGDDE